jgi:hypothetical protein
MKNLKNLEKTLTKAEQKEVNGGRGIECIEWNLNHTVCLRWGLYWV